MSTLVSCQRLCAGGLKKFKKIILMHLKTGSIAIGSIKTLYMIFDRKLTELEVV